MPAQQNKIFFLCQFFCHFLVKSLPLRRKIDNTEFFIRTYSFCILYPCILHFHFRILFFRFCILHFCILYPLLDPFLDIFICQIHRLSLHQHSRSSSIRIIIYTLMLVKCKIPYIDSLDRKQSPGDRSPDNTCFQSVFNHFGKQRKYMKVHSFCFS